MEIIRGKQTSFIDAAAFSERWAGYATVHIDLGTGDGHFVRHIARTDRNSFVIGMDAARENLRKVSRRAPANALFVIANALTLPAELHGLAAHITVNFPWGSLLTGLLNPEPALLAGLRAVARPDARLEIRLNGGALAEAGWLLEEGGSQVWRNLIGNGFEMLPPIPLAAQELRSYPTTWAKRLAFGRDPRAVCLHGMRKPDTARQSGRV